MAGKKKRVEMYTVLGDSSEHALRIRDDGSQGSEDLKNIEIQARLLSMNRELPAVCVSEESLPWNARAVAIRDPQGPLSRAVVFGEYPPTETEFRSTSFLLQSDEVLNPDHDLPRFLWILDNGDVRIEAGDSLEWAVIESWKRTTPDQQKRLKDIALASTTTLILPRIGGVRLLPALQFQHL